MDINEQIRLIKKTTPSKYIKADQEFMYVPIGVLQKFLDKIFGAQNWSWKITSTNETLSFLATGDLTVTFADGSQIIRSGAGASMIRCDKKTGNPIGNGAVMDFPKANSEAFKNACQQLGRIFGRDLRRNKDVKTITQYQQVEKDLKVISIQIKTCTTMKELDEFEKIYSDDLGDLIESQRQKIEQNAN